MNTTIENICYEYAEDVLFSQEVSESGAPFKIIAHLKYEYIPELTRFLFNHGYSKAKNKRSGKYFTLVHFELGHNKIIDLNNRDILGEI